MSANLFEAITAPDQATALDDGLRTLRYGELRHTSRDLAQALRAGQTRVAALECDNGIDWLAADLACQLAGVCLLPLPGFFSPEQRQHALSQAGADTLMIPAGSAPPADGWRNPTRWGSLTLLHSDTSASALLPPGTGKITYTSGSTGTPKGVCLSNAQLIRQAQVLSRVTGVLGRGPTLRHLCLLPLSVLLENIAGAYTGLVAGGTVLVPSLATVGLRGSSQLNMPALTTAISRHAPDTLIVLPQMLTALVAAVRQGWHAPDSLFFIAVGGSKVSPALLTEARTLGLPVYEGYGLSECGSVVSLNTPEHHKPGSVGRPLPHLQVDASDGEVHVSGNSCLGYVGEPRSWRQRHIRTGDLGTVDDQGFLHLQGRRKNLLINSFGRNISPEWVEAELTASGLIREALVFGDARPYLVALIHADTSVGQKQLQAIITRCNEHLPDYARIHNWHRLSQPLACYPGLLTATGKPRRQAIGDYFADDLDTLYCTPQEAP